MAPQNALTSSAPCLLDQHHHFSPHQPFIARTRPQTPLSLQQVPVRDGHVRLAGVLQVQGDCIS